MTTTSQPDPDDTAPDLESGNQQSESKKDAQKTVPLGEHIELRQELRKALDRLEKLESAGEPKKTEEKPKMPQAQDNDLASAVRELQRDNKVRTLTAELGLDGKDQVEAVLKILDSNPGLTAAEAKTIASVRSPEAFGQAESNGYDPAVHGSMRPRSASTPPETKKSDFKERVEVLQQTMRKNKTQGLRGWNNLVGSFAAKAAGRQHDLMPIPKKES